MRKFTSVCIDDKTKYEMVLSECSFNEAAMFLSSVFKGKEPLVEVKAELTYITFIGGKKFCYDETRGYLMKCF